MGTKKETDVLKKKVKGLNKIIQEIWDALNVNEKLSYLKSRKSLFGIYSCLCVSTIDYYKQNRIKFFSPLLHKPNIQWQALPYAFPISPLGGFDDSGVTWVPPAGSTILVAFEGGFRRNAYYLGTTWSRRRNENSDAPLQRRAAFQYPVPEYEAIYKDKRDGYLVGPNDGSQVFPPWNTENYNGFDIDSIQDVETNPNASKRITYPNIYGFKTPEKHMVKMVDGDARCNRRWKRLEIMSGNGNWLIMKDDPFHYCGQWANPKCGQKIYREGDVSCIEGVPNPVDEASEKSAQTSFVGSSSELNAQLISFGEEYLPDRERFDSCKITKELSDADRADNQLKSSQNGTNPFFKQASECRPYRGPGTPENNKCDLPQTGIQILSLSGHSFVMDDSVEYPSGESDWHRSLSFFDYGCTDLFMGRVYLKSSSGHSIEMNDLESTTKVRDVKNGIKLQSALGNLIFMCDESFNKRGQAADNQGIIIRSTSNNIIQLSDEGNKLDVEPRTSNKQGPVSKATGAKIMMRTGYGLMFEMRDASNQEKTENQFVRIIAPQKDNKVRGPHVFVMAEKPTGKGQVLLRTGGEFIQICTDDSTDIVGYRQEGDKTINNDGNKAEIIARDRYQFVTRNKYEHQNGQTIDWADQVKYVLAGKDYPLVDDNGIEYDKGPGVFNAVFFLPYTDEEGNYTGGGELRISDRVFISGSQESVPVYDSFIRKI
jgi:hypothetical protein